MIKNKLALTSLGLLGIVLAPIAIFANHTNQQNSTQDKSAKVRTLTGCLS